MYNGEGAHDAEITVFRNEVGNLSSNPWRGSLHFKKELIPFRKVWIKWLSLQLYVKSRVDSAL